MTPARYVWYIRCGTARPEPPLTRWRASSGRHRLAVTSPDCQTRHPGVAVRLKLGSDRSSSNMRVLPHFNYYYWPTCALRPAINIACHRSAQRPSKRLRLCIKPSVRPSKHSSNYLTKFSRFDLKWVDYSTAVRRCLLVLRSYLFACILSYNLIFKLFCLFLCSLLTGSVFIRVIICLLWHVRLLGHVIRMEDCRIPNQALNWSLSSMHR